MTGSTDRRACERIYREWHELAKARDVEGLLALYADDATFESPLVSAVLGGEPTGLLEGAASIRKFLEQGTRGRPNDLVRWYRTGSYLTDGRLLMGEYPRQTPDGDQIDTMEVMEVVDGLIQHHRIYWGWKGCLQMAALKPG